MTEILDDGEIRDTPLGEALGERYLSYALSTIMSRSLPDVRDGMKPVHRRILFAMRQLKLNPETGFKKCARIVGDVMGKFHPHGDQAIYDALVRLAQEFAQRYPLVDGQGNFGNVDGDNAAAMRYTEARMTAVAQALLQGIDLDTVDFRGTYDGEDEEPMVLPAAFPNLLANGATGIAVGMATSIPPHNIRELCAALLHLIKTPNVGMDKLVQLIPGPDFPTGGVIVEDRASIMEAYRTGRGGFRLRAKWEVEQGKRGTYNIVVTEIPYQVPKGRVIEKIADLMHQKKLPLLADIRDESAEDIRLVLEPKSGKVEADMLMEHLFRLSDLEVRFGLNLNVLDADQTPRVMSLREALQAFLDHRHVVLVRRSNHRLGQIERRLEVLGAYLICYLNLDEVIRIIREEDHAKPALIKAFDLTENQAEAILNMRLRALRRLEEIEIRAEDKALKTERKELNTLLASEPKRWAAITEEIREMRKTFGDDPVLGPRRSQFADAPTGELTPIDAMVEKEPVTIVCSDKGWLRALRGHVEEGHDVKYKDGDKGRYWLHAQSTDKLVLFATNGRFYTLACDKLPGGRGNGEPVRLLLDLANDQEIVDLMVHDPERKLLVAATDGRGFVVEEKATVAQTRSGRQVLNVSGDVEAAVCAPVQGDHLAVVGDNHKLIIFPIEELPEMTRGRGVVLQKYRDGGLADAKTMNLADGLTWKQAGGRTRTETDLEMWLGKRSQAGRLAPKGFPKNNRFS
ncbi:MAG: DNA topoisomerase IV subunit A [Rhodospirillaceae bacterium]|jgi:topoisomerase-4 subunit A|nr:DNA topoisomerase IV subunit A [Rhodospirillaceae bacterium]MBT5082571.1 DNA topoisomerase IV subunit A [Rhodospirillaceae bacterium]MBT5526099.1 DNA topoisomerase IV subunit A [Rhodospirillaceae bacterium]MBT5879628.1 DNA topoisomerase IV subunit A [Rhodospirillaceae bacterium]MBT6589203.1 DNA topoisomerase IV subunit A [Rhodospirillaceae bacterium]